MRQRMIQLLWCGPGAPWHLAYRLGRISSRIDWKRSEHASVWVPVKSATKLSAGTVIQNEVRGT